MTTQTLTLTEFLLARVAEDADLAESANVSRFSGDDYASALLGFERDSTEEQDRFASTHTPDRVLAECEAKRRIVEVHSPAPCFEGCRHCGLVHGPNGDLDPSDLVACPECSSGSGVGGACTTLAALALPYVDHPDYREEWRP